MRATVNHYDCIIVGDGVAGLSAALVLGRARRRTLVLGAGPPRNAVAARMHGFLSREGIPPGELLAISRDQIAAYPDVAFRSDRVVAAARDDAGFTVRCESGDVHVARRLLLATGVRDVLPAIDGVGDLWGTRAFTCPYCDGWEFRDRRIAVIGGGCDAISLAREMMRWSRDLFIVTTDASEAAVVDRPWFERHRPEITSLPIARMRQAGASVTIVFADGSEKRCDAAFFSAPLQQRSPLPALLGCVLDAEGSIVVDDCGRTSVGGCYAAGDAANHRHQVVQAAAGGSATAMALNEDLIEREW
jgi:thioredoxin reductase